MRLQITLLQKNWKREMANKANFILFTLVNLVAYFGECLFFVLLYQHTNTINGWGRYQALTLIGVIWMVDTLNGGLFHMNILRIPTYVQTYELDYFLLKPINTRRFLTTKFTSFGLLSGLIFGFAVVCYACFKAGEAISAWHFLCFAVAILCGLSIVHCIFFTVVVLSLRFIRMDALLDFVWSLLSIGKKPASIYPQAIRLLCATIVPVIVIYNFPVNMLFHLKITEVALTIFLALGLWVGTEKLWQHFMKYYYEQGGK